MAGILSHGYYNAIPVGQFWPFAAGYPISATMQTVFETRRTRLRLLIEKYGSISALNRAIGWEATNARLSQIQNRSMRRERGTPYEMGDTTAREIEVALALPAGWLDTPPGYAELHPDDSIAQVMRVMESMPPYQRDQAMRLVATLAEPAPANGTTGGDQ